MKRVVRGAIFAAISFPLAACSDMDDSWLGGKRANLTAQYPVVDVNFERIDLIAALAGDAAETRRIRAEAARAQPVQSRETTFPTGSSEVRVASIELSMAYQAFYARTGALPEASRRLERNRIQDQVFSSSQLACAVFKRNLRIQESRVGFLSGAATTVLGGLGAIFTSANTARALAGSAGITSGLGAEFRQAHFANLATEVITAGIDAKRASIYDQIDTRRHHSANGALSAYSMENAIHDTIRYHAACSVDAGFEAAKEAIQLTRNPGLNELDTVVDRVNALRNRLRNPQLPAEQSSVGGSIFGGTSALAMGATTSEMPMEMLAGYRNLVREQTRQIYRAIEDRLDDYKALAAYKGDKLSNLRTELSQVTEKLTAACTVLRGAADRLLSLDVKNDHTAKIALRIAQLEGDAAKTAVDQQLRELRWAADTALLQPIRQAQETWDIHASRLRAEIAATPEAERLAEVAKEAKALNDQIDALTKKIEPPANKSTDTTPASNATSDSGRTAPNSSQGSATSQPATQGSGASQPATTATAPAPAPAADDRCKPDGILGELIVKDKPAT